MLIADAQLEAQGDEEAEAEVGTAAEPDPAAQTVAMEVVEEAEEAAAVAAETEGVDERAAPGARAAEVEEAEAAATAPKAADEVDEDEDEFDEEVDDAGINAQGDEEVDEAGINAQGTRQHERTRTQSARECGPVFCTRIAFQMTCLHDSALTPTQ